MAVYICSNCDSWIDDDYSPMQAHPRSEELSGIVPEVVCEDCYIELKADMEKDSEDSIPLEVWGFEELERRRKL